jgi:hypothetical protein
MMGVVTIIEFHRWCNLPPSSLSTTQARCQELNSKMMIIGMAHSTTEQEMSIAFKHGMQYFLPKPIDTELMMSIINKKKEVLYDEIPCIPNSPSLHSPSLKNESHDKHDNHDNNYNTNTTINNENRYFHSVDSQENTQLDSDFTEMAEKPVFVQCEKTFLTGVKLFRRMSIKQYDQRLEDLNESNYRGI